MDDTIRCRETRKSSKNSEERKLRYKVYWRDGGISMLPESAKNEIEQIWLDVIAGGVSQPTEVIEQLTYLMFAKQLD